MNSNMNIESFFVLKIYFIKIFCFKIVFYLTLRLNKIGFMTERQLLTDRFIKLFMQFSENGDFPYGLIAKILDISIKTVKRYEQKVDFITYGDAYLLCQKLDWSTNYMFQDITNWEVKVAEELEIGFDSNIPAKAGHSTNNQFFNGINLNSEVAKDIVRHQVDGDSMFTDSNGVEDGDKIESVRIFDKHEIKEGKIYVIETEDGSRVKKLDFYKNENNEVIGFYLHSTLSDIFKTELVICDENNKIYEVTDTVKESKRKKLKNLVVNDKFEQVLDVLIKAFEDKDKDDFNNLLSLKMQFIKLQNDLHYNGITQKHASREQNRICKALLYFIDKIDKMHLSRIDI